MTTNCILTRGARYCGPLLSKKPQGENVLPELSFIVGVTMVVLVHLGHVTAASNLHEGYTKARVGVAISVVRPQLSCRHFSRKLLMLRTLACRSK